MGHLKEAINIGEKLERQLNEVDITTIDELKAVGSRDAWLRILMRDPSACFMRLCALEGAILGIRWHNLDDDTKAKLKAFYNEHKVGKK